MSLIDSNWDYHIDIQAIEDELFHQLEEKVNLISENVRKSLENGFQTRIPNCKQYKDQHNITMDLKSLLEKNKQLEQDLVEKFEELKVHEAQYENYKQECKLLSQEVKETHEAFLMAKKYYKKFLKIYYTIESTKDSKQVIFLQFFTEAKQESEKYSVRLSRDVNICRYELIDMNPKIKQLTEVQELLSTNDVPGALSFIRERFLKLKSTKKIPNNNF